MRLTITSLAIVIIGWLVCGQTAAGQQNDESARATLRGIRRVAVVVSFQGDAVFQQFEKAPIIKDVEQRLVMAGLSVVSLNQVVNGIASGEKVTAPPDYLYVYANAVKSPVSPFCATSVSIEVNRRVRLDGIQQSARAVTWKTGHWDCGSGQCPRGQNDRLDIPPHACQERTDIPTQHGTYCRSFSGGGIGSN